MAQQKEFVYKVKVVNESGQVVEQVATNFKDLNKSIKDLKDEIENTDFGSEQWNALNQDLKNSEESLKEATQASNNLRESQKSLSETLTGAPGIVGQVSNSVKGLSMTFKALLANPVVLVITAIVGSLTLLFKAFTSTKAGGEALERVMSGLGAVMDVLRDRVLKVGEGLVKFFTGDFSGAFNSVKESVSGVGDEITKEFQQAMSLKKELQSIDDAQRELNKTRAEQNKLIADAKLKINDENLSYSERLKALESVRKEEIALAKQEEILAQRRYDAIKAQNALSDSSKEALDAEAAAYTTLQQKQLESSQKQKELFDQEKALRDRQKAEQKAAFDARQAQLKEAAELEQQLNLDLIQSAEERSLKELDIQKQKQIEQIKLLKLSKQQEAELILKVETTTQLKRQEIETKSYNESIARINEFRQYLIDQELIYSDSVVQLVNARMDEELSAFDKILEGEASTWDRRKYLVQQAELETEKQLKKTEDAYDVYYSTLRFQADEALAADLKNGKIREQERQKQLSDVDDTLDKRIKALDKEKLSAMEYMNEIAKIEYERGQRVSEINTYFDDYEKNRIQQYDAQIQNILDESEQKKTDIRAKYSEKRKQISEQEQQAELARQNLAIQSLDVLSQVAGQETALGKALAVASTTISTYQAAQQAYASQLTIPTPDAPVRAAIAAGIAITQGLLRVSQIMKVNTDVKGYAEGGMIYGQGNGTSDNIPVMVSNGESIMNARSTEMFSPILSVMNQMGGGRRFQAGGLASTTAAAPNTQLLADIKNISQNTPIQTYVVSTEVSTQQQLDRMVRSRSML